MCTFSAVIVHTAMYSPGSYRRIHGQKGPACKPGHTPRDRERPYPGWLLGTHGWTCHDFQQNSPEIQFYYKAKGRKGLEITVLFIPKLTWMKIIIHKVHDFLTWMKLLFIKIYDFLTWMKIVIHKDHDFFHNFSFYNSSALLTKWHVNITHAKLASFAASGRERMIRDYAIKTGLDLNLGSSITVVWPSSCSWRTWWFILKNWNKRISTS